MFILLFSMGIQLASHVVMEGLLNILQQGSHMHGRRGMLRTIYSKLSRNKARNPNHLVVLLTESTARWCFQRFPKVLFQPYTCHKKYRFWTLSKNATQSWDQVCPTIGRHWEVLGFQGGVSCVDFWD